MLALFLACQTTTPDSDVEALVPTADAPAAAAKGTTMLALNYPAQAQRLVELDHDGNTVWTYDLADEMTDRGVGELPGLLSSMEVLDDGNVLFAVYLVGIFEVNRSGDVVWQHLDPGASHDVDRLANGNTLYARTWAGRGEAQVIEVDGAGETVWSWDGLEAFGGHVVFGTLSDEADGWMHVNEVDRADDGTTLVVIRNFNKLVHVDAAGAVVDTFTFRSIDGALEVGTRGFVDGERPHGVEFLGEHHFVAATRRPHRIVEVDGQDIVWSYGDPRLASIHDVDRLPDGNTLFSAAGHVAELDGDGRIQWEWDLGDDVPAKLNPIVGLTRVAADGSVLDRD